MRNGSPITYVGPWDGLGSVLPKWVTGILQYLQQQVVEDKVVEIAFHATIQELEITFCLKDTEGSFAPAHMVITETAGGFMDMECEELGFSGHYRRPDQMISPQSLASKIESLLSGKCPEFN